MAKVLYEESNIQAIADAIRSKNGTNNTYKTSDMAAAIAAITTGGGDGTCTREHIPEEAYALTGDIRYAFGGKRFKWFAESCDKITTNNITEAEHLFDESEIEHILFDLNFKDGLIKLDYAFNRCEKLKTLPKCHVNPTGATYSGLRLSHLLHGCYLLTNADNLFDEEDLDSLANLKITSKYSAPYYNYIFQDCYSLRQIPKWFWKLRISEESTTYPSYNMYNYTFGNCRALDELENLPVMRCNATATENLFVSTFNNCSRLKKLTFETQEDGSPYVVNWKNQIIDLYTYSPGYVNGSSDTILKYDSGITADKEVIDDATYQALKDDPDWFTRFPAYCRYNHDSAVETINSLPDTSAAGGGNSIKFRGTCGSATDGGAISTLTKAEVQVARNKGWDVYIDGVLAEGIGTDYTGEPT